MRYGQASASSRNRLVQIRAFEERSTSRLTLANDRKDEKSTKRSKISEFLTSIDWETIAIIGLLFGAPTIGAVIIHFVLGG